jgi:hypothetical protein
MSRILLDFRPMSGFLKHAVLCMLFVCPYGKSLIVLGFGSMQYNRNGCVLAKTGVFIPLVSLSDFQSESQSSAKNPIQNP